LARKPQLTGRAAILAVVVCAIAMSLAYPVRTYIEQRRDIAELREERSRVEAERQRLVAERRQIDDPNWIKRTAKERLHYCEPGAKCYVVMGTEQAASEAAVKQPAEPPPWYQTLWESVKAVDTGEGRKAGTPDAPDVQEVPDTARTPGTERTGEKESVGQ